MAPRKRRKTVAAEADGKSVSATEKIAGLLALIATQNMDTDEAAIKLDGIGFNAHEISMLLDVGPNYVNVARHRKRSGGKKPKRKSNGKN